MRVEILPALVRVPPEQCMQYAINSYCHRQRFPIAEQAMWQWLFRWAGMPL